MPDVNNDCVTVPVSHWKRWAIGIFALFLILGHCYDMITQREHWPFSYYPMYGRLQTKSRLEVLGVYGIVIQDGRKRLLHITNPQYVPPLGEVTLRNILLSSWGPSGKARLAERNMTQILTDYLRLYEARRVAGLHDGPQMIEVQLCSATYVLRGDGAGQKASRITPLMGVKSSGAVMKYFATTNAGAKAPTTTERDVLPITEGKPPAVIETKEGDVDVSND